MAYIPGNVPTEDMHVKSFLTEELNRIKLGITSGSTEGLQAQIDDLDARITSNDGDILQLQTESIDYENRITTLENASSGGQTRYEPAEDHPDIELISGPDPSSVIWNSGDLIQKTDTDITRSLLAISTLNVADVSLVVTLLNFPSGINHSSWPMCIRMQESGGTQYFVGLRANNNEIQVYELINDVFNLIDSFSLTGNSDVPITLELKGVGGDITITESNGTTHASTTSLTAAGRIGYVTDYWPNISNALARNYIPIAL